MSDPHPSSRWLARLERDNGPIYLGLVRALEAAIQAGDLQPGDRLPPQRTVADLLGIDFTTVTRAYSAARGRGLIEGAVGRGTFVRARATDDDAGLVDLSMNLPPPPRGVSLGEALQRDHRRNPAAHRYGGADGPTIPAAGRWGRSWPARPGWRPASAPSVLIGCS